MERRGEENKMRREIGKEGKRREKRRKGERMGQNGKLFLLL
jgi:hypothetical protein